MRADVTERLPARLKVIAEIWNKKKENTQGTSSTAFTLKFASTGTSVLPVEGTTDICQLVVKCPVTVGLEEITFASPTWECALIFAQAAEGLKQSYLLAAQGPARVLMEKTIARNSQDAGLILVLGAEDNKDGCLKDAQSLARMALTTTDADEPTLFQMAALGQESTAEE